MNLSSFYYKNKINPDLRSNFSSCFEPILTLNLKKFSSLDTNSVEFFKFTVLNIFSKIIDENLPDLEINLDNILNIYINNSSKLDVSDLLNLAELYCVIDPTLYLNKKNMKNIISQILQDLKRTIPDRHPDDNIQLLNQLSCLQSVLPFEIESISYDTWVELGKVMILFEKNIVSLFHMISHKKALFRLSSEWGFLLRDKFFYKLHELILEKQNEVHPRDILGLCITLSRRNLLDSTNITPFQKVFNQESALNLMNVKELIQILDLNAEFDILAKESFEWIVDSNSEEMLELENLPELLDLYLSLKSNTLENNQINLESSIKSVLDQFNQKNAFLNQKEDNSSDSDVADYFVNEANLYERFQRILRLHKSQKFSNEMFVKKFSVIMKILIKAFAVNGVKSESNLMNIKHDIMCLGEPFDALLDQFNS